MNLFGQTDSIHSFTGDRDSLVVIDIATIKEANSKLIERRGLIKLAAVQDSLIKSQNKLIEHKDVRLAGYQKQIDSFNVVTITDKEQITKLTVKARNRLISTGVFGGAFLITLLIAL